MCCVMNHGRFHGHYYATNFNCCCSNSYLVARIYSHRSYSLAINEITDSEKRLNSAVKEYLDNTEKVSSTVILCQTNKSRQRANASIREQLVESGNVKDSKTIKTLSIP